MLPHMPHDGLLRFARNDGGSCVARMSEAICGNGFPGIASLMRATDLTNLYACPPSVRTASSTLWKTWSRGNTS